MKAFMVCHDHFDTQTPLRYALAVSPPGLSVLVGVC